MEKKNYLTEKEFKEKFGQCNITQEDFSEFVTKLKLYKNNKAVGEYCKYKHTDGNTYYVDCKNSEIRNKTLNNLLMPLKQYQMFTGKVINFEKTMDIKEILLGKEVIWNCIVVDLDNMKAAIDSITFNGASGLKVSTEEGKISLIMDYCNIRETIDGKYYLMLLLDEEDEQNIHLIYKLYEDETEEYKRLNEECKAGYALKLLTRHNNVTFTKQELDYIKEQFETVLDSEDEIIKEHRGFLDKETIENIKHMLNKINDGSIKEHEKTNRIFIETIWDALGLDCWVEYDVNTTEELTELTDATYAGIYDKVFNAI